MKKLNIRQFGIGTLMRCSPLISADSKYVFTIGDGCVYVWVVKTGECLRLINHDLNSTADQSIVSIALNPQNRLQLCVGEQSGLINIWDYEDGILIHKIDLGMEVVHLHSVPNAALYVFVKQNKTVYSLRRLVSLRHETSAVSVFDKLPCLPKCISFDNQGELCVFVNVDGSSVYLLTLSECQMKHLSISKKNLSFHGKISCAQIHPQRECLALGTQSGRIALWYNFSVSTAKEPTVSYLHWHSLPVLSLSFSFDGSYLLSGGHECVLVKWLYRTSQPTFRPRLGAPLIHLSCSSDQTFYACTHSDNIVHLIGSNLSIEQTIGGINQMFLPQQSSLPAGIHVLRKQNALIMNSGKPGYLQLMSIENGKLLYNLDIVGENYVSPNQITEQCLFTDIKRMTIDPTDSWLVTFEERSGDEDQEDRKLRFWKCNPSNEQFELNTTITYPHGQETLNQMEFHPNKLELATTGNDGFVKVWTFIDENPITKRVGHWRCWSGHTHRSYSSFALSYSNSSFRRRFLGCSFEHLVTLWFDSTTDLSEESRYELGHCLTHFDPNNKVKSIVCGSEASVLVCHTTLVNLWNSETGEFIRSFSWHVHAIARDPKSSFVALFDKSFLHFYSFADGKIHSRKSSVFRRVTASVYIPLPTVSSFGPLQHSRLVFYIPQQGLKTFVDDEGEENNDLIPISGQIDGSGGGKSLLASLIRQSQGGRSEQSNKEQRFNDLTTRNKRIAHLNEQLLSTPAYLLPSLDHYCLESLKRMLIPVSTENDEKEAVLAVDELDRLSTMSVDSDSAPMEQT